jgi:hypothetical protein
MLGRHPDVVSVPSETYLFSEGIAPLVSCFHHGIPSSPATGIMYIDRSRLVDLARQFCDGAFGDLAATLDPRASRVVERTPWHAKQLDLIAEIYPDAHVVHIIRDGRAVVRSLLAQPWGPTSIEAAAAEWAGTVESARAASVPLYREVRYEDLVQDTAGGMEQVFRWLGLTFDGPVRSDVLQEAELRRNATFNKESADIADWWGGLTPKQQKEFERSAGPLLRSLGYPAPSSGAGANQGVMGRAGRTARMSALRSIAAFRSLTARRGSGQSDVSDASKDTEMEELVRLADRFVAAIDGDDQAELISMLDTGAVVTIWDSGMRQQGHGDRGRLLLLESLRRTQSRRQTRVSGDATYSHGTCTAVLTYRDAIAGPNALIVVMQLGRATPNAQLSGVTLYQVGT